MKKMGGMGGVMGMLPGMGQIKKAMAGANLDDKVFEAPDRRSSTR
jgi:signal recognition particle subunit SRP54